MNSNVRYRERAVQMVDANPDAGLIYAVLDLAQAIRENGTDLEEIAKHHEILAKEVGGVAQSITDISREMIK